MGLTVLAGEGPLGAMFPRNVVLLGRELGAPLSVSFFNALIGGRAAVVGQPDYIIPGLHGL
jgi:hypothetical protein